MTDRSPSGTRDALRDKLASLKWHIVENTVNKEIIVDLIEDCQRLAGVAQAKQPCEHKSVHDGPRVDMRYGSAPTQVCDCGMWRINLHVPGVWRAPPISSTD